MSNFSVNTDPAERLVRLERRQRLLPALTAWALISLIVTVAGFVARGPGVIQAERVELVDGHGAVRADLATDTAGVSLTVYDKRGQVTGSVRLNSEPRLAVRDAVGREVAALGAPRVQHLVQ